MALRLFHCQDCGHKLRYGARHCGQCGHETPTINRRWPIFGLVVACGALLLAVPML